jgi:putative membrane protein
MSMLTMAGEMAGHWGGGPGAWWPIFPIFWVLFWGIQIFTLFRFRGRAWGRGHSAEDVLAERYARGEIAVDEYRERLRVLKQRVS